MNTFKLSNITLSKYRKILTLLGFEYIGTEGDHEHWYKNGFRRRITFPTSKNPIKEYVIITNNRTLGLSRDEFKRLFLRIK